MTARHMIDGIMRRTKARCHLHLSILLGIDVATISRLHNGQVDGVRMLTIDQIQRRSGVPFDDLFAWYRQPPGPPPVRVEKAPAVARKANWTPFADYADVDAALLTAIDAGRGRRAQLESDSALLEVAAPLQGDRPTWRVIDYRLQVLRKRGVLAYATKKWLRAGKYGQ